MSERAREMRAGRDDVGETEQVAALVRSTACHDAGALAILPGAHPARRHLQLSPQQTVAG